MGKICCVTGHRPKGFPWDYGDTDCIPHQKYLEKMALCIRQAVCAEGAEWFIAGGALGWVILIWRLLTYCGNGASAS